MHRKSLLRSDIVGASAEQRQGFAHGRAYYSNTGRTGLAHQLPMAQ